MLQEGKEFVMTKHLDCIKTSALEYEHQELNIYSNRYGGSDW